MSNSVRPHRQQPTRLPRPWDSPGKSTGVGCHCLLQCMKVKSDSEVTQSCPTLRDHMNCSLPGSSVCGIFPGKSIGVGCHCLLWQKVLILYKLSIWKGCDSMNENICTKVGTYSSINYSTFLNVLHSSTTWHRKWGFKVLSGNTPIEVAS